MSAPSSMWSDSCRCPPQPDALDLLSPDERKVIERMRAKKDRELKAALRKRERADRLEALKREIAELEKEGL